MLRQAAALKDHSASAVVADIAMFYPFYTHKAITTLMTFQYYNYGLIKF